MTAATPDLSCSEPLCSEPLCGVWHGRLWPLFTDEAGFAHAAIGSLPFPANGLQVFAMVDQQRPQSVKDAFAVPAADRTMHCRVAAEVFRQTVPLTAGACAVDHAVQTLSLVRAGTAHTRRRVKFVDQWQEQLLPQEIGGLLDRRQRLTQRGGSIGYTLVFKLVHASLSADHDFWDSL